MHNILNGTDARTVRPYMPLARKSSCHSANPKVQYSMFNVQSPSPYITVSVIFCHKTEIFDEKHAFPAQK
ncbi:hypothetical protein [Segatella maculosa]|uniref:hypothetical protein n=1 Tax=Segatella maculosa TaxID=439703 RepID=UPI001C1233C1|nr:hypothetical protein [Segatella maculosa]